MVSIEWDQKSRDFLRKLPKNIAKRIFTKVDKEVSLNVERHLETLVGFDFYKIRIGDYRLFVDYDKRQELLTIRTIKHRRDAYKR